MTNKEAIVRIREHKIVHKMDEPRAIYISEALDMAIEALEEQEFKITPDENEKLIKVANEAEKITKGTKCSTPKTIDVKSCSYLLPCGMCDKTNQKCNLVDCVI